MFKIFFRKYKVRIRKVVRKKPSRANYLEHKEKARTLVLERLEFFNQHYNFKYNKIAIKDHTTRWGSCSSKKNLNFNYRIAIIPAHMADYIIVHELCHLGEFNHSQKFWDLVGETIPDYEKINLELRKIRIN